MRRAILVCLVMAAASPSVGSLSNLVSAWGHDFTVMPFEPKTMMVAVATDMTTGAKFNIVKLPNGHLMAVVPIGSLKEPPSVEAKDMM